MNLVLNHYGTQEITGLGMAGNFLIVLNEMKHFPNKDIYVDMFTKGKCIAYDEEYTNETGIVNPWEYYFDQKCGFNTNFVEFGKRATILHYCKCNNPHNPQHKEIVDLFWSKFSLKPYLKDEIDNFYKTNFENFTILGIQIRLTDMVYYHNTSPLEYFINKTKEILKTINVDKIFIATDNDYAIHEFKNEFNLEILHQSDILRAKDKDDVEGAHHRINTTDNIRNERKYHNFLSAKEVLKDIFLLSKVDYLLRSHSSVSDVAIVLNDKIKKVYI